MKDDDAATGTHLTGLAKRLEQTQTQLLAGHLHEPERGDLGNLMLCAVTAQTLDQTALHQIAVGLKHHVDEVDHDDAADVAQAKLANNLFCGFKVVLGNSLFKVSTRSHELSGVHINNGHGLGAVNHE